MSLQLPEIMSPAAGGESPSRPAWPPPVGRHRGRGRRWAAGVAALALAGLTAATARAEPVLGVDAGAAVPLSKYADSVSTGGAVGVWGGYGLDVTDWLWAGVVLSPRFTVFSDNEPVSDAASMIFSLTAGPSLTATAGDIELFATGQGGLYTDVTGPFGDTGGGWNAGGGLRFYLVPKVTSFGAMARYETSDQTAAVGSGADREFIFAGFTVEHRYRPPEAVEAVSAPPPSPPAPPPAKQKLVLRGVRFDFDRATLGPEARPVLDEAIAALAADEGVDVVVEGYTDSVGAEAYNLRLSERRARAVADYLAAGGIAAARLGVKGYGEADPVASNATADGRAQNRRVELRVSAE